MVKCARRMRERSRKRITQLLGLIIEETAEVLKLSPDTVKRAWSTGKAWLYQELAARRDDGA